MQGLQQKILSVSPKIWQIQQLTTPGNKDWLERGKLQVSLVSVNVFSLFFVLVDHENKTCSAIL
jgi:hypothetical protein